MNRNSHTRVLVVADWDVDAQAIVAACERWNSQQPSAFRFVVPARLRGLDWAGDPWASVPCADRQLESITRSAQAAGLNVTSSAIGDPDVITAIGDAVAGEPADELVLCLRASRFALSHPFDLAHRAQRLAGVPVERIDVSRNAGKTSAGGVAKGIQLRSRCSAPVPQQGHATVS
jgi:hypothetical protein